MVCMKCGSEQGVPAQFCRQCGSAIQAPEVQGAPPPPQAAYAGGPPRGYAQSMQYMPQPRVRQNLQPLGVLWCVFGAYRLLAMLIGATVMRSLMAGGVFGDMPPFASHLLHSIMPIAISMAIVMAAADILTGYALLTRQPWARILAIVLGILTLIKFPFGTALGIYTLWVLAPQASRAEWDQITGTPV